MKTLKFNAVENRIGVFWVSSHTTKGQSYKCSLTECGCGAFVYHQINPCKHMEDLVKEIRLVYGSIGNYKKMESKGVNEFIEYIDNGMEALTFINWIGKNKSGYDGNTIITKLIHVGAIYERMGKLYKLK